MYDYVCINRTNLHYIHYMFKVSRNGYVPRIGGKIDCRANPTNLRIERIKNMVSCRLSRPLNQSIEMCKTNCLEKALSMKPSPPTLVIPFHWSLRDSCRACHKSQLRTNMYNYEKHTSINIPTKPKKRFAKSRLLWSCPSRTGNNSCKRARGRESIEPDNISLSLLCKSIYIAISSATNLAPIGTFHSLQSHIIQNR